MTKFAKYLCGAALAGILCVPAVAQYQTERQDQTRHDQDDRNRANQDPYEYRGNQANQDRDRDRDNDRGNGYAYGQNPQWRNSKAYQQGMKDGDHDRSKNKGQNLGRHHWKNDQDRQAYEAGYMEAYGGNNRMGRADRRHNDHDRDDMNRRDRDQR